MSDMANRTGMTREVYRLLDMRYTESMASLSVDGVYLIADKDTLSCLDRQWRAPCDSSNIRLFSTKTRRGIKYPKRSDSGIQVILFGTTSLAAGCLEIGYFKRRWI